LAAESSGVVRLDWLRSACILTVPVDRRHLLGSSDRISGEQ
jgi:hypothetical protein